MHSQCFVIVGRVVSVMLLTLNHSQFVPVTCSYLAQDWLWIFRIKHKKQSTNCG